MQLKQITRITQKKLEKALCFDMKSQNVIIWDKSNTINRIETNEKPLYDCIKNRTDGLLS